MLMLRSPIRQSHDPACLRVSRSLGPLHRLGRVPPAICSQGQVTTDICRGCRVSRPTRKPTRHADAATARWVQSKLAEDLRRSASCCCCYYSSGCCSADSWWRLLCSMRVSLAGFSHLV